MGAPEVEDKTAGGVSALLRWFRASGFGLWPRFLTGRSLISQAHTRGSLIWDSFLKLRTGSNLISMDGPGALA